MKIAMEDLTVVHDNGSWDYQWYAEYLYYHAPSGRYFMDEQGGCSCNSYEDPEGYSLDSFETWSREEALRHTSGDTNLALRDFKEPK